MAKSITEALKNGSEDIVAICVLKGSFIFFSDLIRKLELDLTCDFLSVSSYEKTKSRNEITLNLNTKIPLKNKQVLLVEDIVDTGLTMKFIYNHIKLSEPKKLITAILIQKPENQNLNFNLDYIGFKLKKDFVVGYGLDYQGYFRHLPYIASFKNMN